MKLQLVLTHIRVAVVTAMGMAALTASNRAAFAVEAPDDESPAIVSEQVARLVNEKMILSGDTDAVKGSNIFDSQRGLFKLSPDGRKLLFYREEPTEVNGRRGVLRLVLRDLTDGSEALLPFPALPKRWAEAVVFDSTTSETKNLSATGSIVTAGYDHTGDRYIVSAIDQGEPDKIRLLLADTDLLNWQEHVLSGVPRAISPGSDLIMLLKTSELNSRELPSELLLYDAKDRKEVATLPAFKLGGALSMYTLVFVPQWTISGGHLYYSNIHGFPDDPRYGTRVWQRQSQAVIKELKNVIPIGPGPTKSSMVLTRVDEVKERGSRVIGLVVHEASNNQTWEIPLPDTRILGTQGSQVIYARKDKVGKEAVYTAEIVLPKDTNPLPE